MILRTLQDVYPWFETVSLTSLPIPPKDPDEDDDENEDDEENEDEQSDAAVIREPDEQLRTLTGPAFKV